MSLVKDPKWWRDPSTLDPARRALRMRVHQALVREVTSGADGRAIVALFTEAVTGREGLAVDTLDFLSSELPGRWVVLSEEWQGRQREDFYMKALYVDEAADCACVVAGDASGDGEPQVDSIWLGLDELRAIGTVLP